MKNGRLGLLLIAVSILVISLMVWLLHAHQLRVHRDQVRILGVTLVRALSGAALAQLVPESGGSSLLNTLISVQRSDAYAYGVVLTKSGTKVFENVAPGSIVPAADIPPADPSAWFGEHTLTSPGDDREIREFFGPVLQRGELAGFVRVGFYARPQCALLGSDTPYASAMALLVLLFTTLPYLLFRRELRPLFQITSRLSEIEQSYGGLTTDVLPGGGMRDFMQRFDQFTQVMQTKVRDQEEQRLAAQTTSQLLAYKQKKMDAIFDAIPEALLVIDESSTPSYANLKIESLLGVSRKEVIGISPQQWCSNKEVLALLIRLRSHGGPVLNACSLVYVPEEHSDRKISAVAYPLSSPNAQTKMQGMLIVFRDISEEQQARQAGVEFVAHVAHELKTPLSGISAYSELLFDYAGLDEKTRVTAVNAIHEEAVHAAALINNLLNISKLETGALSIHTKRVNMSDLLREAAENMRTNAAARNVSLVLDIAPDLSSAKLDKDMIRIAIDNLLGNAFKYSNPGGTVTLRAENLDDLQMKISVRDQGIGISPEDCAKVFDKYYRSGDNEVATRSGHGLGLFLVKQIVEMHYGTISVSSELGKWTEFTIQFHTQTQELDASATA